MIGVIVLYIMIQMWIFDADKKADKKGKRKTQVRKFNDGWEVYTNSKVS